MTYFHFLIHAAYHQIVVMQKEGVANDCWLPCPEELKERRRWSGLSIQFRMATRKLSAVNL